MSASPVDGTVVLGVMSRSRDALKGKAQSWDMVALSSGISSRRRKDGLDLCDLWPPISATETPSLSQQDRLRLPKGG